MSDTGTVFGWGSNAGGQLGKPPIETDGKSENTKVLVMKTTKRIIKLQHGLQNSCDSPLPITGTLINSCKLGNVKNMEYHRAHKLCDLN